MANKTQSLHRIVQILLKKQKYNKLQVLYCHKIKIRYMHKIPWWDKGEKLDSLSVAEEKRGNLKGLTKRSC